MKNKCAQHPEKDGLAKCYDCGAYYCEECAREWCSSTTLAGDRFFEYSCSKCRPEGEKPDDHMIAYMRGNSDSSEIYDAATNGDLKRVKSLLEENPNVVFSKDHEGLTPLHYAVLNGNKDTAEFLLSSKAEVNSKDYDGKMPLHYAASEGYKEIVDFLLVNKAEINARDKFDKMPLHYAASEGHKEIVEFLLDNKAEINARDIFDKMPLHYATYEGHEDVVELLRRYGGQESEGLHLAAGEGDLGKIKLLLTSGADVNAKELGLGASALLCASQAGHYMVAQALIENGADVNASNKLDQMPLHLAANHGHKDLVELLLFHKAKVNVKDRDGFTPLHCAACNGKSNVVKLLIANKAEVVTKTNEGDTPLELALGSGHMDVAELLRQSGGNG